MNTNTGIHICACMYLHTQTYTLFETDQLPVILLISFLLLSLLFVKVKKLGKFHKKLRAMQVQLNFM